MAVQILNDMPDAAVHRGDTPTSLSDWSTRVTRTSSFSSRPAFVAITIGLHVVAVLGFLSVRQITRIAEPPTPIVASIIEAPVNSEELPPMALPPMTEVQYVLPSPDIIFIETESITAAPVTSNAIAQPTTQDAVAPMVVLGIRARARAAFPLESNRRRSSDGGRACCGSRAVRRDHRSVHGFDRLDVAAATRWKTL